MIWRISATGLPRIQLHIMSSVTSRKIRHSKKGHNISQPTTQTLYTQVCIIRVWARVSGVIILKFSALLNFGFCTGKEFHIKSCSLRIGFRRKAHFIIDAKTLTYNYTVETFGSTHTDIHSVGWSSHGCFLCNVMANTQSSSGNYRLKNVEFLPCVKFLNSNNLYQGLKAKSRPTFICQHCYPVFLVYFAD